MAIDINTCNLHTSVKQHKGLKCMECAAGTHWNVALSRHNHSMPFHIIPQCSTLLWNGAGVSSVPQCSTAPEHCGTPLRFTDDYMANSI